LTDAGYAFAMMLQTGNFWVRAGVALMLALGVAACGVKSQPVRPDGATYPKQYPTPLPPLKTVPTDKQKSQAPGYDPDSLYQYPNQPPNTP